MSKENDLKEEELDQQEQNLAEETDNLEQNDVPEGDNETSEEESNEAADDLADDEKPKAKKKGIFGKSNKSKELEDALIESQEKVAEINDKYLRLYSEFDNFRKRTMKEKMELYKTAAEDVIKDLLPVVDDFERAIQNTPDTDDMKAHMEGMLLIYNKMTKLLEQKGVKEIEAKEHDFDTDLHEAITKIPAPTEELKGKVVDVVEKGYTLNEKVIRFAKVVIGE